MDNQKIIFNIHKLTSQQKELLSLRGLFYDEVQITIFLEKYYSVLENALAVAGISVKNTLEQGDDFMPQMHTFFKEGNLFYSACQHYERINFYEQVVFYFLYLASAI